MLFSHEIVQMRKRHILQIIKWNLTKTKHRQIEQKEFLIEFHHPQVNFDQHIKLYINKKYKIWAKSVHQQNLEAVDITKVK